MRSTQIGTYEHGRILLVDRDGETVITVRWPFDLSNDEWIYLSLTVPSDSVVAGTTEHPIILGDADQRIAFRVEEGNRVRATLKGRNSTGPVEADLLLGNDDFDKFLSHFSDGPTSV